MYTSTVYGNALNCKDSLTNYNNPGAGDSDNYITSSPQSDEKATTSLVKDDIHQRHLKEWIEGSGVREDIARSCLESLDNTAEIASRLGWKGYRHTSGWWVSGIDLHTGERAKFGQFKPDEPILFPDAAKPAKYLTPKQFPYDAIALPVRDWQEIIDDPSIGIVDTEGPKKVGAGETCGYPTVGVVGVEMGLIKGKLVPNNDIVAVQGRPWTFAYDSDIVVKKGVQDALKKKASVLKRRGCVLFVATWNPLLGKGIDDVLVNHGKEKVDEIMRNAVPYSTWLKSLEGQFNAPKPSRKIPDGLPKSWDAGSLADWLLGRYRDKLAWDVIRQSWLRYSSQIEGIWNLEHTEFVQQIIKAELAAIKGNYTDSKGKIVKLLPSLIEAVEKLLKMDLAVRKWDEQQGLIPLLNGVLNPQTYELKPHAPGNRLTWCLPYNYNLLASCDPIQEWLLEMCQGDRQLVQLLQAYLHGIVTSRLDWQKYLELIGPGGTGKSTLIRLAIALVGQENVHTTTLQKLEGNRFETASIKDKRLVIVTDSERYSGGVSILKALTGQDTLPYEEKFKQSRGGFNPMAMVIVAANETIQSGDYTSGLERRRMTVPMTHRVEAAKQRNLIEHRNGELFGEFVPYVPGLLNWVLGMNPDEATDLIKNYSTRVPSLTQMKAKTLVEINPIADWVDHALVYRLEHRTQVGVAKRDKSSDSENWFYHVNDWLYANYSEYCHNVGTKAISCRRFVNLLDDLCVNQLGLDVEHGRDRKGAYFLGLKIRSDYDEDQLLITGDSNPEGPTNGDGGGGNIPPTPPPSPPPTEYNSLATENPGNNATVMDVIGDVTDSVTAETLAGDGCDGCDGLFKLTSENENNLSSVNAKNNLINNGDMPSHPSQGVTKTVTGDGLQQILNPSQHPSPTVTESITGDGTTEVVQNATGFKQGDCVRVNCPNISEFHGKLGVIDKEIEGHAGMFSVCLEGVEDSHCFKSDDLIIITAKPKSEPTEIDFSTFPHRTSNNIRAKEKQARHIKEALLNASDRTELTEIKGSFGEAGVKWVWCNLLTDGDRALVKEKADLTQLSLL